MPSELGDFTRRRANTCPRALMPVPVRTGAKSVAFGREHEHARVFDAIGIYVVGNVRRWDGTPDLTRHRVLIRKEGMLPPVSSL
jgi:hypothetical protein